MHLLWYKIINTDFLYIHLKNIPNIYSVFLLVRIFPLPHQPNDKLFYENNYKFVIFLNVFGRASYPKNKGRLGEFPKKQVSPI